ncbi:hypothetical protein Tco_0023996 [Tanacetum coccineum]
MESQASLNLAYPGKVYPAHLGKTWGDLVCKRRNTEIESPISIRLFLAYFSLELLCSLFQHASLSFDALVFLIAVEFIIISLFYLGQTRFIIYLAERFKFVFDKQGEYIFKE